MALPNPTLTWQMTGLQALGAATPAGLIAAIEAAVATLVGDQAWTTSTPTGGGGVGLEATLLTPPAGSPVNGAITAIIGVSDGTSPLAAQILDTTPALANNFAMCSLGGAYAAGNNWYDPDPYGAGIRYIEMASWVPVLTTITHVFVIASEESIFVGARVSDIAWYGTFLGAIVEPPDLASAEADERVYGFVCSGNAGGNKITTPITGVNLVWGTDVSSAGASKGAFFDPTNPTATIRGKWLKLSGSTISTTSGLTLGGNPFFQAIYYQVTGGTGNLGRARGLYYYQKALMRSIVQDTTPADRGYVVGTGLTVPEETVVFGNAV